MQKPYLLLRNNRQMGPFDLEELLRQDVKPHDLIWVEGRSAAWRHPREIEALQPFLPQSSQKTAPIEHPSGQLQQGFMPSQQPVPSLPGKVFVSMPNGTRTQDQPVAPRKTEQGAGARELSPGEQPSAEGRLIEEELNTKYARKQEEAETAYMDWVYQSRKRRRKSVPAKTIALVLAAGIAAATGYLVLSGGDASPGAVVAKPLTAAPSLSQQPLVEEEAPSLGEETVIEQQAEARPVKKKVDAASTRTAVPSKAVVSPEQEAVAAQPVAEEAASPVEAAEPAGKESGTDAEAETSGTAKKKKLGERIKDMFGKAKEKREQEKTVTAKEETARPATNRQVAKRGDGDQPSADEAAPVDISSQVDLSDNAPENWMMGVAGLKITLRNRSTVAIQSALVHLSYYDGNNNLLEKKTIQFNNIPARGRMTLPAPDHKWAERADYKLGNVTVKDDRYAAH
ncbi:MAG TPA: hypothetical protein VFR58_10895 [Flavisolibacter sp.]|nr:hypothetical protein [Flavisolibacter sp.]